jgi:hypothetical protein
MKQKSHSPELISRPLVTRASQENDAAKIKKIIESAQEKLKILSESYRQVYNPKGFITDLKIALGMDPQNASGYAIYDIGENQMRVSIRVSNHHANARKYLEHEPNDFNLSVMVSKRYRKNTFQADSGVVLKEFVYMGRQLETVESPFSQIATSLAQFLETSEYMDTTGVAKVNISPAPTTIPPPQGGGTSTKTHSISNNEPPPRKGTH